MTDRLTEIEGELKIAREKVLDLRKQLLDAETSVIGLNIEQSNLSNQLREYRDRTVSYELSNREKEIESFKKVLPDIMRKI